MVGMFLSFTNCLEIESCIQTTRFAPKTAPLHPKRRLVSKWASKHPRENDYYRASRLWPWYFPIKRKTPIVGKADCRTWDLVPVWVIVQYRDFLVHQVVPDAGFYVNAFQIFWYWSERKRQHEATIMQPNLQQTHFLKIICLPRKSKQ